MAEPADFQYVDFACRSLPGFRNNIVRVQDLPGLIERYGHSDCYSTYFLFTGQLREHVRNSGGSVAGFQGPSYAQVLALDIDSEDREKALETARDLCCFMLDHWGASENSVVPYFSGSKGLHITVATRSFGEVEPGAQLPNVFQEIRRSLLRQARPKYAETVDLGIGDRLRLLRLPNTRHSKSGLYKVPLTLQELLDGDPAAISSIAETPRQARFTDATGLLPVHDVDPLPDAVDLYERCVESATQKHEEKSALPDPTTFLARGDLDDFLCEAERKLYEQGVPEGARSWTALRLASRTRSAGYSEEEAARLVLSWNDRNRPPLPVTEARRIVHAAYQGERPYQFGCGTGEGDPPHTDLIRQACPYTNRSSCQLYQMFRAQRDSATAKE